MEHKELTTTNTEATLEAHTTAQAETHAESSHEIQHESTLYAEPVSHIGSMPITNALVTSWITVGIIVIIALALRSKTKLIPGKLQHLFEMIYEGGLSLADQVTNSRAKSKKIFPIAISIFFFVLINNWLGILPLGGLGLVETHEGIASFIPFIRSGTADINTTIALAIMAVLGANIFGAITLGVWKMFNKFVNLKALGTIVTKIKKDPTIVIVAPITFFVGLIEIVGEIAKIASLSFRLFGNVFAGEVLLASMTALVAYVVPIPFLFLEILVGVIQALIFSMLTLVYFTIASDDHEEHDEEHAHEPEEVHELEEVALH
jgi:F-type H+-transporting ATPase subunit a